MSPSRLGVLGTFVWDTIWHPGAGTDGPLEQWGGIAYSLAAVTAACPPGWEVVPIARIGADLADAAIDFVRTLPHLPDPRGIRVVHEPTNRVELKYLDGSERTERLTGGVSGWSLDELLPLVDDLDALYINFISGFEIDLATAERLRAKVTVPIYSDLHSLFLGPPGQGPRQARPLPHAASWLRCFDAVQVNEGELSLMTRGATSRGGSAGTARDQGPQQLLASVPDGGPQAVFVTRGGSGASAAWLPGARLIRTGHALAASPPGAILHADFPAPGEAIPGDPTGCGDVWGSVAFAGLLEGRPVGTAVARAHGAAVAKIRCPSIDRLHAAVSAALASPSAAPRAGVTLDPDP